MQKIIEQNLGGSEDDANSKAEYTWEKDEIAFLFCTTRRDVNKVQFDGKRWLSGNKWGRNKIYQYKYLETSGNRDISGMGLDDDGISWDREERFFSTREEAIQLGFRFIERVKNDAIEVFEKDMEKLTNYEFNFKAK